MKDATARNLCPDHRDKIRGLPCLKCTVDRLTKFVDAVIETLDPQMRHNAIVELREKAIRLRSDCQKEPETFRIPTHGSYWEDLRSPVKYLLRLSTENESHSKVILSLFQAMWPQANELSLRHYLNKGWSVVGISHNGELVVISKRDFNWVVATFPADSLKDDARINFNSLPLFGAS